MSWLVLSEGELSKVWSNLGESIPGHNIQETPAAMCLADCKALGSGVGSSRPTSISVDVTGSL
ncbi:hypothetical protein N7519_008272 [Penicillium mononematosum]|uniref:uncharacterized protein n=1 Tax=Penicillium mononematosum TaxID=268346 RepID=UPI00254671F5|nr:uncharacterized protein N7519_008272 [Penicillium mononematosum]KAJ6177811.1 hypothetical protein N7519_008272 [Penicillium mononematosum]